MNNERKDSHEYQDLLIIPEGAFLCDRMGTV